ncbi:TetR/AcrR family transcriptional regulator [Acidihalobacter prosperus]|uniref:HTH tetR-type domain-containing protein n=1 Tax=Acidihalobacter prosperus TaxID=160660 RepID=A0A1A6C699_9GAMM|nr:TetR/AcrR family transcriptional regulator [Acidihalobacter prosperus]OBS10091.1 hypothetical protein Thpro_021141 [Acidihalobacter prosperus]
MSARNTRKRDLILAEGEALIYRQGFRRTTLADIAHAAKVALGNIYYYFKTKDELLEAISARRVEAFAERCREWETRAPDPRQRLQAYLEMPAERIDELTAHGCPIGSLAQEFIKEGRTTPVGHAVMNAQMEWVERQFQALGRHCPHEDAAHLIGAVQGAILMAASLNEPALLQHELDHLHAWLQALTTDD